MHLGSLAAAAAARWPHREALVCGESRWTFETFNREVEAVAKALMASGVVRGDRVAIWMTNRPQWLFLMFGIARIGATVVPLNTRYRAEDIAYTLAQSRCQALVTHVRSGPVDFMAMLLDSAPELRTNAGDELTLANYPELRQVVTVDACELPGVTNWNQWLAAGVTTTDAQVTDRFETLSMGDDMMIMYTSGTTGDPKGAAHSHAPVRNTIQRMRLAGVDEGDTQMSYLPFFHIYGFSEIAMGSLATGARQVMLETFDAGAVLDLAESEGATMLHGFDAHWLDLLRAQEERPRDLNLRVNTYPSGMASSAVIAAQVETVFGTTLSGWGMSEAWCFVTCNRPTDSVNQRTTASGAPMDGYEFKTVDPVTGEPARPNEPGELFVRGYALMRSYFDKPAESAAAIDVDGWLHTGDMCRIREDGHIVFMGRFKDVLKVGGENVSPAEVEALLLELDGVLDAAVVGISDERLQEVVVAYLLVDGPSQKSEADVIAALRGRIASFKIPRHVFFEQSLPMTPSGKVRKVELRADAERRLRLDEAP